MPHATRAGDVLADRYRLVDLLSESGGGRFWRAHDRVLERHVALHVMSADDPRAELLTDAARRYFRSQPIATASVILMTGLHLTGGLPRWCDPFSVMFSTCRRLRLLLL